MQNLTVAWLSRAHLARIFFVGIFTKPVKTAWARTTRAVVPGQLVSKKNLLCHGRSSSNGPGTIPPKSAQQIPQPVQERVTKFHRVRVRGRFS